MPAERIPAGRTCRRPEEPGHGDEGRRLHTSSTRASGTARNRRRPSDAVPADLEKYGFDRWNPPDAGANQTVPEAGGGFVDNDGRFIDSTGEGAGEGALAVPRLDARQGTAVLHGDLAGQPARRPLLSEQDLQRSGLRRILAGTATSGCRRPTTRTSRPSRASSNSSCGSSTSPGSRKTRREKRSYLNYYGNLMRSSDSYLVNVLDKLEETGLLDNTLIVRTADHGEMGLTHGGLRQKNFNFYEEAIRVPLVYSNPKLFPRPLSDRRAGLPRRLPADAGEPLRGAAARPARTGRGSTTRGWSCDPEGASRPRTTSSSPTTTTSRARTARRTRNRRTTSSASAKGAGSWPSTTTSNTEGRGRSGRCTTSKTDPLEQRNLASRATNAPRLQEREFQRLKRKLARVERTRLKPL